MPAPVNHPPWLPDLCRLPRIAAALGVAEAVVVLMALAPSVSGVWSLKAFLSTSGFALWMALYISMLLCHMRRWVHFFSMPLAILLSITLPMLVAGFGAWCIKLLDIGLGYGLIAPSVSTQYFVSSIVLMVGLITAIALRYFYVREQWQSQVQAQAKAQVDALQARIRPHFLFNSMNSIASLIRSNPKTAETAVEDLADLFRAALGSHQGHSTLDEEITLAKRYIAIEALRLGERLACVWTIEASVNLNIAMPRLVLQPLLENAVIHGISRLAEGGQIEVNIQQTARVLSIEVRNPAPAPAASAGTNQHAQDSIAKRLAYHFGAASRFEHQYQNNQYIYRCQLPLI